MTPEEKAYIDSCAVYLRERAECELLRSKSFYDREGYLAKLDSAEKALTGAIGHLRDISLRFALYEMDPFLSDQGRIDRAYNSAFDAQIAVKDAIKNTQFEHLPRTRKMPLQKSAMRLALAYGDSVHGQARRMAQQIITKANLNSAEASSFTKWRKAIKKE